MKIYELIKKGQSLLMDHEVPDSDIDAELLFFHVSHMTKMDLLLKRQDEADSELTEAYMEVIEKRCQRIPLQYITGTQDFMGYTFFTDSHVLIPRYDTETLVCEAVEKLKSIKRNADGRMPSVLDMCCGSGCIGLSIAKETGTRVTLSDISDYAISLTEKNAKALDVKCDIIKSNLFENINDRFDIIVSNPPYIRSEVIETLMPEVKDHEPRLALDGSADGLVFYRSIAETAREYFKGEGYVLFEIGDDQAKDVQDILVDFLYEDVQVIKDLAHRDRVVYGRYTKKV